MGTFSQIQAKVRTRLIDLPTAVTNEVPSLINFALQEIQQLNDYEVMKAEAAFVTNAAGSPSNLLGARPSNFKEFRGKPYYVTNLGKTRRLEILQSASVAKNRYGANPEFSFGSPRAFLESEPTDISGSTNFLVYPFPDEASDYDDGEYRIYVPYWKYLPALSAAGDENFFTTQAEEYIVARATAEGFVLDWDEERYAIWMQKAEQLRKRFADLNASRALSQTDELVPRLGVEE